MRTLLAALLLALPVWAQAQTVNAPPPDLQPVPDAAPVPPPVSYTAPRATQNDDEKIEEGIVITQPNGDKTQEYRSNGKVYMIKVTPSHGVPYYLIDDKGDGKFIRQGTLGDHGVSPPMWVIHKF